MKWKVIKMLKKIALPVVALVVMLILASAPAKAAVRFGITIGPPVYTYPAYPYDPHAYAAPYVDPYVYPYNSYYYAPAPAYVYPYFSYRSGWNSHRAHEFREHHGHEFRGHEKNGNFGGNGFRGGHRR